MRLMAGETPSDRRPDGAGAAPVRGDASGSGVGPVGETWLGLTDGPLPVDEVACLGRPVSSQSHRIQPGRVR